MLSLFVPATLAQVRAPKPLELSSDSLEGPVFVVPVNGMIDNGLARYIDRAVRDATDQGAVLTVFEIDTFGGLVDAADKANLFADYFSSIFTSEDITHFPTLPILLQHLAYHQFVYMWTVYISYYKTFNSIKPLDLTIFLPVFLKK